MALEARTGASGGARFQMMDITVTVLGLSGILAEKRATKGGKVQSLVSKIKGRTMGSPRVVTVNKNNDASQSSLQSNSNDSSHHRRSSSRRRNTNASVVTPDDDASEEDDGVARMRLHPTFALASFTRNALDSDTTISTHVPSLALTRPVRTYDIDNGDSVARYTGVWPAKNVNVSMDDIDRSSVSFSRVLRYDRGGGRRRASGDADDRFVPELVSMKVGLISGGEMITLGQTTLVVSGVAKSVEFKLPLSVHDPSSSKQGGKRLALFRVSKEQHNGSFAWDPSVRYRIDDNATLRVMLTVVPHNTVNVELMTLESLSINPSVSMEECVAEIDATTPTTLTTPTTPTTEFTFLDLIHNIADDKSHRLRNTDRVQYTNPRLLRLSEQWSKAMAKTNPSDLVDLDLQENNNNNDNNNDNDAVPSSSSSSSRAVSRTCVLSPECASLEVEAMALLASIEQTERRRARIKKLMNDMDDIEIERELANIADEEEDVRREMTLAVHGRRLVCTRKE